METQGRAPPPPPTLPPPPTAVDPIVGDRMMDDGDADDYCIVASAQMDQGSPPVDEQAPVSSDAIAICNALLEKIVRQVEYYFSDGNLPNDKFLLNQMRKDKEGYVPISAIASFKKMKKLTEDLSLIEAALRTSSLIAISSDGRKVKRLQPLPLAELRDVKPQIVLVENLPEDHSEDNIRRIFGTVGHIVEVIIRNPHSEESSATLKNPDLVITRKLHALVEYDTVEAAETAVSTLNDENNWSGMRVELLLKRMVKYGKDRNFQKGRKDVPLERNDKNGAADSSEMSAPSQNGFAKEEEKLGNVGGKGARKRSKNKGRGHHHQTSNDHGYQPKSTGGQGHGSAPFGSSTEGGITNKPIPGPKMPDGTRGFTMGRGRSIIA